MISKKEFYFIRHGQTDYNLLKSKDKGEHPKEISLNDTGKSLAASIEPLVATLPVKTICASPLKRVQQTKEMAAKNLLVPQIELEDLMECSAATWAEMYALVGNSGVETSVNVRAFFDRVSRGVNKALTHPGPVLIFAHGGIHFAICSILGINTHGWVIENCKLVHFSPSVEGEWRVKIITEKESFNAHNRP